MARQIRLLRIGAESAGLDPSLVGVIGRSLSLRQIDPPATASALPALNDVDAVLVDIDAAETDVVDWIRARSTSIPILVTVDGADMAEAAVAAGATDVLTPTELADGGGVFRQRLSSALGDVTTESASAGPTEPYRALVDSAGDPMYVLDASGTCTVANEALASYTGYDREELIGAHAADIIGTEDFERASERLRQLVETDEEWARIEFTFEGDEETVRICEATLFVLYEDGAVVGSAGVVRDVSEREARERELAQYETIVETAPIGLFAVDEDGVIIWANDEFVDAFKEPASEIVGEPFTTLVERGYIEPQVITDYLEYVRALLSSAEDDKVAVSEVQFHELSGETRQYDTYNALLPLDDGEYRGTVHAFRDVTDERRHQRELERQNDRLERFASLVSHDLRNPLNVAQGHVDVLERSVDHDSLAEVSWALSRMGELIDDLLELARQGQTAGDPEPVELGAVAADAWEVVETGQATIECAFDESIRADDGRLRELFTNLFRNAVEHADDRVTVRVGWLDGLDGTDGPEEVTAQEVGFYVEDDGPGLPDEDVFEVGYTTADDGTGFGLAIVAEIAEAHGWSVTAGESDTGGARFEFRGVTHILDDE